jgi:Fe-S-cluster-containing hydrogenase component 2
MAMRNIVRIDEERCDGCGNCVIACAEGALEIREGKAKIIKEAYCDGLGACIGECPQDALIIESREAAPFDEVAMEEHLKALKEKQNEEGGRLVEPGCPGAKLVVLQPKQADPLKETSGDSPSALRNWPIQIHLLPTNAPFFKGADLLIGADCVAFAMGGFHESLLRGKVLALGCPKLDDVGFYVNKLAQIFSENDIQSVTVGYMEVPCCAGLVHVVQKAVEASGKAIPVSSTKVSLQGEVVEERES